MEMAKGMKKLTIHIHANLRGMHVNLSIVGKRASSRFLFKKNCA
jgi:hypothetical protein